MATEFQAAITAAFNPNSNPQTKARAVAYCEALKTSQSGFRLCLENLLNLMNKPGSSDEVKFWCLEVLNFTFEHRYKALSQEELVFVRQCLMKVVKDLLPRVAQPPFITTKLAVVFVQLIKRDYPERWPSFFTDFISLLRYGGNAQVAGLFVRVLKAIVEEIVVFDEKRDKEEVSHNMLIKDTMRGNAIRPIVETLYTVLLQFQKSDPKLAQELLDVLADYIGWIELDVIANTRFITVLYRMLEVPLLQEPAVDCINELIEKRTEPSKKLALIKSLNIVNVVSGVNISGGSQKFVANMSSLVDSLGNQLLDCVQEFESGLASEQAVSQELQIASTFLNQTIHIGYRYFNHDEFEVAEEIVPLYLAYINRLKTGPPVPVATNNFVGSSFGVPMALSERHFRHIFAVVSKHIAFPSWFSFDHEDDREVAFLRFRNEGPFKLFINMLRCRQKLTLELVRGTVLETLGNISKAPSTRVEAALHFLYLAGEGIKQLAEKIKAEPFSSMVGCLFTTKVSNSSHSQVMLTYQKCLVRYFAFVEAHPQFLRFAVSSFLDKRGLHHQHAQVRAQASYHLLRFIKAISVSVKVQLQPVIEDIIKQLQRAILPVLSLASWSAPKETESIIEVPQAMYICEVIGMLITSQIVQGKSRAYFSGVCGFFQKQLEASLQQKDRWLTNDSELVGNKLSQIVHALGCLTKPFKKDAHLVKDILCKFLHTVIQLYTLLPKHVEVRKKTVFFLHRMVECLPGELERFLPVALRALVASADEQNIVTIFQLLNQLLTKPKINTTAVFDNIFLSVVKTTLMIVQKYSYVDTATDAYTVDLQERLLVFKMYYSFLKAIIQSKSSSILVSETNAPHLQQVVDTIIKGCLHPDFSVKNVLVVQIRRACFSTLTQLVMFWHNHMRGTPREIGMKKLIFQDVTQAIFKCGLDTSFDLSDAAAGLAVREFCLLQIEICKRFGQEYLNSIGEILVKTIGCPQRPAQEYCVAIHAGDTKSLKTYTIKLFSQIRTSRRSASP